MDSDRVPRAPPYSGSSFESSVFRLQDFHLLRFSFPSDSSIPLFSYSLLGVLLPQLLKLVWASSLSLDTTQEIDFSFFSSGYLDVSGRRVSLSVTMCS